MNSPSSIPRSLKALVTNGITSEWVHDPKLLPECKSVKMLDDLRAKNQSVMKELIASSNIMPAEDARDGRGGIERASLKRGRSDTRAANYGCH